MGLCNASVDPNVTQDTSISVEKAVTCAALSLICLVGLPGNLLVIWIILRNIKHRSPTILLILNLAAADLLTLINVPVFIYQLTSRCFIESFLWKSGNYFTLSSMYASVFSITVISVLRLMAVLHTFAIQKWQSRGTVGKVIIVIWVSAFLFAIPVLTTDSPSEGCCYWDHYLQRPVTNLILKSLVGFAIPFIIICICYVFGFTRINRMTFQTKNKPGKLILSVVVAFALCWLPTHITNVILMISSPTKDNETKTGLRKIVLGMTTFTTIPGFLSVCINPILYAFTIQDFKNGLKMSNIAKLFEEMTMNLKEKLERPTDDVEDQSNLPAL